MRQGENCFIYINVYIKLHIIYKQAILPVFIKSCFAHKKQAK